MTESSSSEPRASSQIAGTAAFSKFMHLLQLVADHPDPLTIPELSKLSGYPRPTVYRTVAALLAEGLLEEGAMTGKLALGPRLIVLASRSWSRSELRNSFSEDLKHLRDITGETVHLAILNGHQMAYIEKIESPRAVQMSSRIGTSVPLHSTSVGKAFMAAMSEPECERLLKELPDHFPAYTANTLINKEALRSHLVVTRQRGWSIDDEEQEPGICCYGAAILGRSGQPIAAVSLSTLRFRHPEDVMGAFIRPLLETCHAISQRIAHTPLPLGSIAL